MTFTTPGAVLSDRIPPDYAADLEDVLTAAAEWFEGRMTLNDAVRFGTIPYQDQPSPKYSRYCAVVLTPLDDPRRPALMALVNRLAKAPMIVATNGYLYDSDSWHQHDAAIDRLNWAPRTEAA